MLLTLVFTVQKSPAAGPFTIYVVNYPLQYFAERIGGDQVKVVFPVPADVDPAYWHPNLADISAYQKADLILLNGAGYAKWVNKVSLPRSKMVNTSRQFKDRYITTKEVMTHSHGTEGEHAHESLAFTTWLDLELAARQAKAIASAMGIPPSVTSGGSRPPKTDLGNPPPSHPPDMSGQRAVSISLCPSSPDAVSANMRDASPSSTNSAAPA